MGVGYCVCCCYAHPSTLAWAAISPQKHTLANSQYIIAKMMHPQDDLTPGTRDAEEFITIHRVGIPELRSIMVSGDMLLPSVATCFLALERLQADDLL